MRFDWQTFSDLRGLTLGGGLEYSYGPAFDAFLERGEVPMERVSSDQQNFEKLLKGRIQLYPQERNVGLAALRNLPGAAAQITHHPRPLLVNQSYLLFPKSLPGSDLLRQRFDQRLQQYRDSGRYQRYFDDLDQGKYSAPQATLNLP
jgi:polar amino acid transport system substrate-binding protein